MRCKDKVSVAMVQKARELATIKGTTAFKEAELLDAEMMLRVDADALKVWQQGCEALPPIDHGQEASRHGLMALPPIDPGHEASMVPPIGNGHEANQQALRTMFDLGMDSLRDNMVLVCRFGMGEAL